MNEFRIIKIKNETTLEILKENKADYALNEKIQNYLQDEAIFFKISKQNAMKILEAVGVKKEELERTYQKLIEAQIYYELVKRGKIKPEDKNVVIKYKNYDYKDMFKK